MRGARGRAEGREKGRGRVSTAVPWSSSTSGTASSRRPTVAGGSAATASPSRRCSRGGVRGGRGSGVVWRRAGHGGGFYSGRAAHGGRGAGAPVAGLGRRRPVEGRSWVAGCLGDQTGKAGRRGALGCVRGHGPAVGVLGRRTACASWLGRGAHGLVLVCCAGSRGSRGARKGRGAWHGRARRCHLGRPARHCDVRAAVAVAGVHTATPATILPPPACGEVVVKRGMQGWCQIDK